jgi:DNA-binding MarR family transcriptional regulator
MVHLLRAVAVDLQLVGADFAARHGMHPTDVRALIELLDARRAGVQTTPGQLGARLSLNSASTTAVIDRLERLGHVRRSRDGQDRRRVLLDVDERAVALGWDFFGPLIAAVVDALAGFPTAELDAASRVLHAVRDALDHASTPL